jgi:hypothetical protein
VVNAHGKPVLWDHDFAGFTREELVALADRADRHGHADKAEHMRAAVAFFDRVGFIRVPD